MTHPMMALLGPVPIILPQQVLRLTQTLSLLLISMKISELQQQTQKSLLRP